MHKPESVLEREMQKIFCNLEIPLNPNQKCRLKRACDLKGFAIPVDHKEKIKESKMRDKFLNLARELKKLRNMKVTVILIVAGVLRTVPKGLEKRLVELEGRKRIENI